MERLDNLNKVNIDNSVLTIGNFDGLHLGHLKIISLTKKLAIQSNLKSLVITFNPHPLEILAPTKDRHLITSNDK